jgi:hypothetical protein
MNRSNLKAYVTAINGAAMNRRTALQTELAVGFAVILECGPSKRLARAQIVEIYATAGYQCREPADIDYKTIARRIAACFSLFDFMGEKDIRSWAGELTKGPLLAAIIEKLVPLKLTTINEVIQICAAAKVPGAVTRGPRPGIHVDTAHIHFVIPPTATRDDLLEAAAKLMSIAQSMVKVEDPEPERETEHA